MNRSTNTKKLIDLVRAPINGINLNLIEETKTKKCLIKINEGHAISNLYIIKIIKFLIF